MIQKMCSFSGETEFLPYWFADLGKTSQMYKDPILGPNGVKILKEICDAFGQNSHVFVMAVEVVEDYLRAKKSKKEHIEDALLVAVVTVFLSHKCEGAKTSLKIKSVVDVLFDLTQRQYTANDVIATETEILGTLQGKLPITTTLDDMDIIIEKYMGSNNFKANLRPLCLLILECVYIEKKNWFKELKDIYSHNKDCLVVFRHLVTSKYYIPVTILVASIELTHYRHILDVDAILTDVTKHTKIHEDHVRILAAKVMDLVKNAN